MIEVTLDQLAAELGMDRLELRRKNFIPKEDFPAEIARRRDLRLGRLPRHARQAARARRRGEVGRRPRSCARGHLPRHRVLDVHGDLRPRAVARSPGRAGFGAAGRPVGVGARARAHHRRGDRLHRHVAARPGHRHDVRPDRRRPVRDRRRSRSRSSTATPATGPQGLGTYGSRSLAVGGEAIVRATDKVVDEGQAGRRPQARGRARGHRAARREVLRRRARRTRA